jgi:hypothetical protein
VDGSPLARTIERSAGLVGAAEMADRLALTARKENFASVALMLGMARDLARADLAAEETKRGGRRWWNHPREEQGKLTPAFVGKGDANHTPAGR